MSVIEGGGVVVGIALDLEVGLVGEKLDPGSSSLLLGGELEPGPLPCWLDGYPDPP